MRGSSRLTISTVLVLAAALALALGLAFGAAGESLYLGYVEKFREINFTLTRGAAAGWTGVLEYASAVDASGSPTA